MNVWIIFEDVHCPLLLELTANLYLSPHSKSTWMLYFICCSSIDVEWVIRCIYIHLLHVEIREMNWIPARINLWGGCGAGFRITNKMTSWSSSLSEHADFAIVKPIRFVFNWKQVYPTEKLILMVSDWQNKIDPISRLAEILAIKITATTKSCWCWNHI